jgi:hypothetical protein
LQNAEIADAEVSGLSERLGHADCSDHVDPPKKRCEDRRKVSSGLPREYDSIASEIRRGPPPEWR